jgi:phosphatidylserine/phosphatidylglycerophosphate/cardiolipin synthase-like enzyme
MKREISACLTVFVVLFTINAFAADILGVYFPPYKDSYLPIIKLYDSAEKYIHLAIYSLTKDEFADALITAHKRGVEVKVLIDKAQAGNQHADDESLENEGIEVRRDKASGLMYNKFAVIDDLIVYTGSYNHTKGGTEDNDENYIIIKDVGIAHIYEAQFQKLWEKHK